MPLDATGEKLTEFLPLNVTKQTFNVTTLSKKKMNKSLEKGEIEMIERVNKQDEELQQKMDLQMKEYAKVSEFNKLWDLNTKKGWIVP